MKSQFSFSYFFILAIVFFSFTRCGKEEKIIQTQTSGNYVQDFNPEYIDVLWVIDDRSSLFPIRSKLVSEAKAFFTRLESVRKSYRMAFITGDMQFAKGALKPKSNPVVLERHIGDTNSYTTLFGNVMTNVVVNLGTSAESKPLEATDVALNNYFKPRANIPLVIIYISDAEDRSVSKDTSKSAVDYYKERFLALKGGDAKLLKVYAVNYVKDGARCTGSYYDADIDRAGYEGRTFNLAKSTGGDTADICGSFASMISLEGLRLKTLPKSFKLDKAANPSSISVTITTTSGSNVKIPFTYSAQTHEIIFSVAPPEGSTISVTFAPA